MLRRVIARSSPSLARRVQPMKQQFGLCAAGLCSTTSTNVFSKRYCSTTTSGSNFGDSEDAMMAAMMMSEDDPSAAIPQPTPAFDAPVDASKSHSNLIDREIGRAHV